MLLRLSGEINIEDRWNHPPESIADLRGLLAAGVEAAADPQRKDFYEIRSGLEVFYIHLCPNGKVLLLAIWPAELQIASQPESYMRAASAM